MGPGRGAIAAMQSRGISRITSHNPARSSALLHVPQARTTETKVDLWSPASGSTLLMLTSVEESFVKSLLPNPSPDYSMTRRTTPKFQQSFLNSRPDLLRQAAFY